MRCGATGVPTSQGCCKVQKPWKGLSPVLLAREMQAEPEGDSGIREKGTASLPTFAGVEGRGWPLKRRTGEATEALGAVSL